MLAVPGRDFVDDGAAVDPRECAVGLQPDGMVRERIAMLREAIVVVTKIAEGAAEHLRHFARSQGDGELRAYLPGTVCKLARSSSAGAVSGCTPARKRASST